MKIVAAREQDRDAILSIVNDAIINTTALWEYEPWDRATIDRYVDDKRARGEPLWVALDDDVLVGYATWGTFRARPAYQFTKEHSVYVDARARRRGVGRALLSHVVEEARRAKVHCLVGGIEAGNVASCELHEALGFERCGVVRAAGYKFDRWLDLALYQRVLEEAT